MEQNGAPGSAMGLIEITVEFSLAGPDAALPGRRPLVAGGGKEKTLKNLPLKVQYGYLYPR
jgi:hypothetical protein